MKIGRKGPSRIARRPAAPKAMRNRKPEPVGSEELKDAILAMIVREFGDRQVDW